jgi:hypothetical protein
MKSTNLSITEAAELGFTHVAKVFSTDLTTSTNSTAQTLTMLPITAGMILAGPIALKLVTPFANSGDASNNTTLVSVGDNTTATQFIETTETNLNGSYVNYKAGTTAPAAGLGISEIDFPITSLAGMANGDVLTAFTPGYAFKILSVDWVQSAASTTTGKGATLTPKIGSTPLTGGVITLSNVSAYVAGLVVAGTAVTAANTGTAANTITVTASAVTTFTEGSGSIRVRIQNLDTVNAVTNATLVAPKAYTAADNLKVTFTPKSGTPLTALTQGELHVFAKLIDLNRAS